jgi:hypothetical protein
MFVRAIWPQKRVSMQRMKALIFTNFCYHNPGITAAFLSACDQQTLPFYNTVVLIGPVANEYMIFLIIICDNCPFGIVQADLSNRFAQRDNADKCSFGRAVLFAHHHSLKHLSTRLVPAS